MSATDAQAALAATQDAAAGVDRVQRLCGELAAAGADALLVSGLTNIRYLTGFTGSNALALVGAGPVEMRRFFTDFRYESQSAEQVDGTFEREIVTGELLEGLGRALRAHGGPPRRLGFDDGQVTVKRYAALAAALPEGWELVPCAGLVERLREIKEPAELQRIATAAALIDDLMTWLCERGLVGRTERAIATELEHQMRLRGADSASFPSIVASGAHAALPHGAPRDVEIPRGVLVTIDMGAYLDGYCSDCTRTFATGAVEDEARAVYDLVLRAQRAAVEAIRAGITTREADAVARTTIADGGYGEYFGHNLGHGVGLEVHEAPRLSPNPPESTLAPGHVVSVEPGIYLPGRLGVRIEDLVGVRDGGCDVYSTFTKDLLTIE